MSEQRRLQLCNKGTASAGPKAIINKGGLQPLLMQIAKRIAQIILLPCLLLSVAGLGAQPAHRKAPLVLEIDMLEGPPRVRLVLRNRSNTSIHVLLGIRDQGNEDPDAFSFLFVNAEGQRIPIVLIGHVLGGNVGTVDEVIAPGKEWQRKMKLSEFMVFKDPANPTMIDQLPAGSYTVYGIFKGGSVNWPPHSPRYWVGTVRSAPIQYVISK
jgi:hypothetical protein